MDPHEPKPDVLDRPVSESFLGELYENGLLTPQARTAAIEIVRRSQDGRHWWHWANQALLFVGTALVLAGVVFFFAYNWARMHPVAKFGVIEAALWLCALGSLQRGLDKIVGKVLLLSASMLVGVLLAVYGQVYQTGADDWKIYACWALLILPWTIISRFHALWVLWLAVTNAAWLLFWFQQEPPEGFEFKLGIFLLLGIWNGLALTVQEAAAERGVDWLGKGWARHLIWFFVLAYLLIPTLTLIVFPEFGNGSLAGALGLAAAVAIGHFYFQFKHPDLLCLGFNILAACVVLLTLIGKVLFEFSGDELMFLFFGIITIAVSSAAAFYLRHLSKELGGDES